MSKHMHHALLGGIVALTLVAGANGAQAQVQVPGWFGSVTGWYYLDSGNDWASCILCGTAVTQHKGTPDDGWGGRIYAGYGFSGAWDIAVGAQSSWLGRGGTSIQGAIVAREKADYQAYDAEIGYTLRGNGYGARVFGGARYYNFDHRTTGVDGSGALTRTVDSDGVGPRIGFDIAASLGSGFGIFAGASGSALFSKVKERTNSPGFPSTDSDRRTVWQVDGQLGLSYEIGQGIALAAGYRADYWNNVYERGQYVGLGFGSKDGDRLMHGPFARVSYNIGAPRLAPVAVAPPLPQAILAKTYIVFFDWDRSTLTPDALKTIADAAAASKTGGVQRVNVTGHADRSGSDQYNMALSLRRAGAVKDQLVRNGVPANQIVVVGRGESQPLVPTADGVREPQNRRVEIVLN